MEYKQFSNFDVLVEDENGKPIWLNGMEAQIYGYPEDEVIDYRPAKAKEYLIYEYDLEKSKKKQYRVVLHEVSDMDVWDHKRLSDRFE